NFRETGRGIVGAMFRVNYKHGDLLDITISIDFCGAYPSTFEHYFTFDTRTGDLLHARDLFLEDQLDGLVDVLDDYLQRNISLVALYYRDELGEDLDQRFTEEDLEGFTVTIDGVLFRHEFGFPHAAEALEPDGEIFLGFEELEGFIDPEGPLGDPETETD
ncbi:hypothetical protein JW921_04200, partial [Candidatus Fermentibacterales bacterium]|nr:hypothetical protein [Candidatus Fermentibacterales bacterium]